MKIIDISWPISNWMTTYKDKQDLNIVQVKTFQKDHVRESQVCMGMHTGTHIDAPSHFLQNGRTIEWTSLSYLIGTCQILDCANMQEKITSDDVQQFSLKTDIILFKTKNSFLSPTAPFDPQFIYLDASAAEYVASHFPNIKAIGFDYLGIERNQPAHLTHTILFENGIVIVEGLRLSHVEAGIYQFICLPLAVQEVEAAPARAILIDNN